MQTQDTTFIKRLKSFLWRAAMLGIAAGLSWILSNLSILDLNPFWTTLIGLVLGEISKYLNTKDQ